MLPLVRDLRKLIISSIILSLVPVPQTNAGAVVGVAVLGIIVVGGTIALIVGFLTGVLLFYCISKHRSKPKSSSHQQQQKAGPMYEEVAATNGKENIVLRENVAYGPVKTIELQANEAYGHVQH